MSTLQVMTWNIENLFRFGDASGPKSETEYQIKLQGLAETILNLDPDVLALQEIGSPKAFNDLLILLRSNYPNSQLLSHPDPRGIRVGFMSKFTIDDFEEIVDFPPEGLASVPGINSKGNPIDVTRLGRGALLIRVLPTQDLVLTLITTQLKSKLLTFPSDSGTARFNAKDENGRAKIAGLALLKRSADTIALRVKTSAFVEKNNDHAGFLLDNLNDIVAAATTQIHTGSTANETDTADFNRITKCNSRHLNLAPLIADNRRFMRIKSGQKASHIRFNG